VGARQSPATRWAIALGAGLAALGAALAVIVVLLRRWVLQPLARLAADAEHIAGGELDVHRRPRGRQRPAGGARATLTLPAAFPSRRAA
jgi:nitrate/nitrite-specific signal transduction histidine kinase